MPRPARSAYRLSVLAAATFIVVVIGWIVGALCVVGFAAYDAVPTGHTTPHGTARPKSTTHAGPMADAIVVLGAAQYAGRPSPVLRARIDHALDLWRHGAAGTLVFTGGTGTRDTTSEAVVSSVYASKHGVPDSAIVLESAGRTTSESMHAVASLLRARGQTSVILVSDPFHMFRLWILANRVGLRPYTSPTRTSPIGARFESTAGYVFSESVKAPIAFFIERP